MASEDTRPFQAFQDARSDLLRATRAFDDPFPGKKAGIANKLASATDGAMEEALVSAGRADLLDQLRAANQIWRETAETLKLKSIQRIANSSPDSLQRILKNTPRSELRALKDILPQSTFNDAAAVVVRDEIIGPTLHQMSETVLDRFGVDDAAQLSQQQISAARMSGNINKMKGRLDEMIGSERANELVSLVADLNNAKSNSQAGQMAFRLIASGQIVGAASGLISGIIFMNPAVAASGLAVAGGLSGAANIAARMLVKQPGSRSAARSFISAIGSGDMEQAIFWSQRFNDIAKREERGLGMMQSGQAPSLNDVFAGIQ
jgi:hypothetical protein